MISQIAPRRLQRIAATGLRCATAETQTPARWRLHAAPHTGVTAAEARGQTFGGLLRRVSSGETAQQPRSISRLQLRNAQ